MNIEYLILHHTAGHRDTDTFEGIKKYHVDKGWGDIGYHYLITGDGVVHAGRSEDTVGAHCRAGGMNFKSLGICVAGNFENEHPSMAQIESLEKLLSELLTKYDIPIGKLLAHKEAPEAATLCCGVNLFSWLVDFRNNYVSYENVDSEESKKIQAIKLLGEAIKLLS